MIDGCGRTDFQNGDAATLYRSVHDKLFSLSDETLVYAGHDYQQRQVSSIGQEKARNPRLGGGKTVDEFVAIMAALDLPRPKKMDVALPANRRCGVTEAS
jgi:glyoxylase-like metal-dependent hydrolase (beta-lactamase superfamily II)